MINSFKNFGTLPKWLVNFESTYDRSTGGWKTRGKIDYEPRLKVGGLILMHDVLFFDGVGSAFRQLILQNRFEYLILETPRHHHTNTKRAPGVAILKKKRQGPPIDFNPSFSGLH